MPKITIPLGIEAHKIASQFAQIQATPGKGKQVYLNTLAVYAVNLYLQYLEIKTDLDRSDSWHSSLQVLADVADLVIPGTGKLECRPILPGNKFLTIPPGRSENTFGCVAVQFSENLNEVELLGFVPLSSISKQARQIPLIFLQSLEVLIDYISSKQNNITNLSCWLKNIFEAGWQTKEELNLASSIGFRSFTPSNIDRQSDFSEETIAIERIKQIDLKTQTKNYPIALIVLLTPPKIDDRVKIKIKISPLGEELFLPPNLQTIVLDETGKSIPNLIARSQDRDNALQLALGGRSGDRFTLKLQLEDAKIVEYFLL